MGVPGGVNEGKREGAVRRKKITKLWALDGNGRKILKKEFQEGNLHQSNAAELKTDR